MSQSQAHQQDGPTSASAAGAAAQTLALAAAIVCVSLAAYAPAMTGGFLWDDRAHVTRPELRSLEGLWHIWFTLGATQQYYPVLHSVFWIEHRLWGDATLGYHLMNTVLHAANACLVLAILRRLKIPGAALAAMIFALHPVHVESVAWITEQKNTLSGLFCLSAMLAYLGFDRDRTEGRYWLAWLLFVLGLLSKTVTATLPAALLVIFWWQRGRLAWRHDVVPLIAWFVLSAGAGLLTAWVERKLVGAEGESFELTFVQGILLAGRAICFYLGKLLWPTNLIFVYPRWEIRPELWWQWVFPIAVAAVLTTLVLSRNRIGRGPAAAMFLFIGTLFPVLGFFNVYPFMYSFVADHFQYLASIGMIALISAAMVLLLRGAPSWGCHLLCVVLLAALFVLTWRQSRMYADAIVLYQTTIDRNPECWMAHNNLGVAWDRAGQPAKAIPCFEQVLRLKPDSLNAWENLAKAYADVGRQADAIQAARRALELARAANDAKRIQPLEAWLRARRALHPPQGASSMPQRPASGPARP